MKNIRLIFRTVSISLVFSVVFTASCQRLTNFKIIPEKSKLLEIHVINVGQGDCFLIIAPTGKNVLIDAGNTGKGTEIVLPYLKDLGITSVDYIVATHYHSDHIGGLDEVVNGLGGSSHIVNEAFDRGGIYNSDAFRDFAIAVGDKRKTIFPGQTIDLGDEVILRCIASDGNVMSGKAYFGKEENALSVVFILSFHSFEMYFGGDSNSFVEPSLIQYARDVDVYKVSHHGSATSSTQQLLDCLKPEVSVIAVGNGNTYGHPDIGTLSKLISVNSYVYQTESGAAIPPNEKGEVSNGSFKIVTDGDSYTISGGSLIALTRFTDEKRASFKNNGLLMLGRFHLPIGFEAEGSSYFLRLLN